MALWHMLHCPKQLSSSLMLPTATKQTATLSLSARLSLQLLCLAVRMSHQLFSSRLRRRLLISPARAHGSMLAASSRPLQVASRHPCPSHQQGHQGTTLPCRFLLHHVAAAAGVQKESCKPFPCCQRFQHTLQPYGLLCHAWPHSNCMGLQLACCSQVQHLSNTRTRPTQYRPLEGKGTTTNSSSSRRWSGRMWSSGQQASRGCCHRQHQLPVQCSTT